MDKYLFAANANLGQRLKNNEMLTSYQIGLIDSSTPFRNELFIRNIGRLGGFIPATEKIDPFEEDNSKYQSAKGRAKASGEWKDLDKDERKSIRKEDRAGRRAFKKSKREKYRSYLADKQQQEETIKDRYIKLFNVRDYNLGKKYITDEHDIIQNPYDSPEMEVETSETIKEFPTYYSKLMGLRLSGLDEAISNDIISGFEYYPGLGRFGSIYSIEDKKGTSQCFGVSLETNGGVLKLDTPFDVQNFVKKRVFEDKIQKINTPKTKEGWHNFYYNESEVNGIRISEDDGSKNHIYIKAPTFTNYSPDGEINRDFGLELSGNEKSLLGNTNRLFKQASIHTMINRFYNNDPEELELSITGSAIDEEFGVSKGRNLLKKNPYSSITNESNPYDNPYCRVWTSLHRYSTFEDAIRHSDYSNKFYALTGEGFRPNSGYNRLADSSVLMETGRPRIVPKMGNGGKVEGIEKCMFSIENLAWRDYYERGGDQKKSLLSPGQIGPNKGRIMWFPPYGLTFNENVNTEWNANAFIGRGEHIYTYVNTERTGTLSFILLIDHPSILNIWKKNAMLGVDQQGRRDEKQNDILRYFAGCYADLSEEGQGEEKPKGPEPAPLDPVKKEPRVPAKYNSVLYFPNNYSGIDDTPDNVIRYLHHGKGAVIRPIAFKGCGYESTFPETEDDRIKGVSFGNMDEPQNGKFYYRVDKVCQDEVLSKPDNYIDTQTFGLNTSKSEISKTLDENIGKISKENLIRLDNIFNISRRNGEGDPIASSFINDLKDGKLIEINTRGYATSQGHKKSNEGLSYRRAKTLMDLILECVKTVNPEIKVKKKVEDSEILKTAQDKEDTNTLIAKEQRFSFADITIFFKEPESIESLSKGDKDIQVIDRTNKPDKKSKNGIYEYEMTALASEGENRMNYDDEYMYFNMLSEKDPAVFEKIQQKIKYFDPAYHSITPEGFNARLTFLQQCMRQGPTNSANEVNKDNPMCAGNLAFGRPPYCVLRIGDFYNTKIVIDSLSIDYGESGNPQWDLNPEGAGVQPMMAKVNIGFKFLGGSDLSGPIEELQNAVSFNYYSNTSVYDRRSSINDKNKK